MYDALTTRYTFSCPVHGETKVRLSAFRRLERLPGSAHPAVYQVAFACGCGAEHAGLVTHDDLDWAPLGLGERTPFLNLMTAPLRRRRRRARRPRGAADQRRRVAVELLLLSGGAAAAGLPVGVRAARAGQRARDGRRRRPLPRLRPRVRQPRLAGARRPAVPQRPRRSASSSTSSPATRRGRSRRSAPTSTRPRSTSGGCARLSAPATGHSRQGSSAARRAPMSGHMSAAPAAPTSPRAGDRRLISHCLDWRGRGRRSGSASSSRSAPSSRSCSCPALAAPAASDGRGAAPLRRRSGRRGRSRSR